MNWNYIKSAWRSLRHRPLFSLIKIAGLGLALTVCLLILLYIKDEFSYDQFHTHRAQIYRITQTWHIDNNDDQALGIMNGIVGETFAREIPGVENVVRVNGAPVTVKKNNRDVFTENPLFVDANFLSVFTFPVLYGDQNALNA